jgi:hypothetical protein
LRTLLYLRFGNLRSGELVLTLLSGAGNIHTPKEQSPADGERGRGEHKLGHTGVLGSVFRSLSRAAGRDKSSDRKPDAAA